jgi:hypothetical protein
LREEKLTSSLFISKALTKDEQKTVFGGVLPAPQEEPCLLNVVVFHPNHPNLPRGLAPCNPETQSNSCPE